MQQKVVIKVSVNARQYISLPAPCTYCGADVAEGGNKEWDKFYKLMHWGPSRKFGVVQLWETKDADGVAKQGDVTVQAPYCPEHLEGVRLFSIILAVCIIGLAIAGLIFGIVITGKEEDAGFLVKLLMIGAPLIIGGVAGLTLAWGINKLLSLIIPAYRDFPALGNGHWGFTIGDIKVDGGEHGRGPIRYLLQLEFLNAQSAQRFLAAYPDAEVIKGGELIQEHATG